MTHESGVEKPAPFSVVPRDLIEAAVDDAVRRASVARDQLRVSVAEAVTWPDGSLGCPQPGRFYTQALVPGYRIVLSAGSQVLNYHASLHGRPLYCETARVTAPADRESTAR